MDNMAEILFSLLHSYNPEIIYVFLINNFQPMKSYLFQTIKMILNNQEDKKKAQTNKPICMTLALEVLTVLTIFTDCEVCAS